jgi:hypothetical protein
VCDLFSHISICEQEYGYTSGFGLTARITRGDKEKQATIRLIE